jgi:hypothetical protein
MFVGMTSILSRYPAGVEWDGAANIMVRIPVSWIYNIDEENSSSAHQQLSLPRHNHPLQLRFRTVAPVPIFEDDDTKPAPPIAALSPQPKRQIGLCRPSKRGLVVCLADRVGPFCRPCWNA